MTKRESSFKNDYLIPTLDSMFEGCVIINVDPSNYLSYPDVIVLYQDRWAMLETKRKKTASKRPNQEYYVRLFNEMSFAAFVYPENAKEVLNELQNFFLNP